MKNFSPVFSNTVNVSSPFTKVKSVINSAVKHAMAPKMVMSALLVVLLSSISTLSYASRTTTISGGGNAGTQMCQGTSVILLNFQNVEGGSANDNFNNVRFTTTGTAGAGDITTFQVYYNTVNTFGSATSLGTIAGAAAGVHNIGFANTLMTTGNTYYFWIVANISAAAAAGNTVAISGFTNAAGTPFTFVTGITTYSGTVAASGTFTVAAGPTGVTASATPNPVCVTNNLTLTGVATGATTYAWAGPGGTAITAPGSLSTNVTGVVAGNAGVYTLTATAGGCSVIAVTSAVVVNSYPTGVSASASPNPVCQLQTLTLTGTATGAATYAWTGPTTADIASATSLSTSVNSAAPGDAGIYTLTASNPGCAVTVTTSAVTVNAAPTGVTAVASPSPVCVGNALTLTGTSTGGGATYAWTGPTTGDIASASSLSTGITVVGAGDAGVYTLSATIGACTTSAVTTAVSVNAYPTAVSASATPNPACSGYPLTLTGTATGATTYAWSGPTTADIASTTSLSTSIPAVAAGDAGVYTLTASTPGCAVTVISSSVVVNTTPGTPTGVATGTITTSSFATSWTAVGGATSYTVTVYIDGGLVTQAIGYTVTYGAGTTATVNGLSSGTPYWYTVTANTTTCSSVASTSQTLTTTPTACSGTPVAGISAITPIAGGAATTFTLSLTGYSTSTGLTYQWQSGPSATGPWSNITGATGTTYGFTGITSDTWYQCIVTCSGSGLSSTSTVCEAELSGCTPTAASWLNAPIAQLIYGYIGGTVNYTVPAWVNNIYVDVQGAVGGGLEYGGGNPFQSSGGNGGRVLVTGTAGSITGLTVTSGHVLQVLVGQAGSSGGAAAFGGGGADNTYTSAWPGSGGGGYSGVKDNTSATQLVIAGGGGGGGGDFAGFDNGGAGGGTSSTGVAGYGASDCAGGTIGTGGHGGAAAGGGGQAACGFDVAGQNGTALQGANRTTGLGSGGGGGGWFGGGTGSSGGGGGGGSSYANGTYAVGTATFVPGYNTSANGGMVTITYPLFFQDSIFGIKAFSVTGAIGSINDANMCAAATPGTGYINRLSSISPITMYTGGNYATSITWGRDSIYQEAQVWVDFNDNGTFEQSEEVSTVVGYSTVLTPQPTTFNISIPSAANTGTHLMRVRGIMEYTYNGGSGAALSSDLDPCLSQFGGTGPKYTAGDVADYVVNITKTPTLTATPTALNFGTIPLSTTSAAQTFSITASSLYPVVGNVIVTAPTNYLVSLTGTGGSWQSYVSVPYTGGGLSGLPIYVEFVGPATSGIYSGNVIISGGSLGSAVDVAVTGICAPPCSGTPVAGTATVSPTSGGTTTTFNLGLSGYSIGFGLSYQWQSSATGTSGWANIPGATNPTYSFTGLLANTYYQCVLVCSFSTLTSTSTVVEATYVGCTTAAASWLNATVTNTYNYIGAAAQTWTAPLNVTSVAIQAQGGTGGSGNYGGFQSLGGAGGLVYGTLAVTPGQTINIYVAGAGVSSTATGTALAGGGATTGGAKGANGGGGGGASDIRVGGTALANRILVAAGGGGGGAYCATTTNNGGYGGGVNGGAGYTCGGLSPELAGQGATQTSGGANAIEDGVGFGALGIGSNAGYRYGGGGGGGYYGGGSGGNGGGGGGSSYVGAGITSATIDSNYNTAGNGIVVLTYTPTNEIAQYGVNTFSVTAATGANLSDANMCASAALGSGYLNRLSLSPITLYPGGTYASGVSWGIATAYQEAQVWIDFNNDGVYQTTEQVTGVVGYNASTTVNPTLFNVSIPMSVDTGAHLMRVRGIVEYAGGTLALSTNLDPCLSQYGGTGPTYNDGDEADYIVNVKCHVPAIAGAPKVCVGSTTTLSDATTGGTWSMTSAFASVGATTGIVTGSSAGTAVLTYSLSNYCITTQTVTVNANPPAISGALVVGVSTANSLSDATTGGTWSATGDGTITGTSGSATFNAGTTAGTATVTYNSNGCTATAIVTVSAVAVGPILGANTACANASIIVSDASAGGTWTVSGDASIVGVATTATVTAGATAGTAVISYTISGVSATSVITINVAPTGVTASATPNPVCNAGTLTLNGTATGATGYAWTGPGGTGITSAGAINASVGGVIAGNAGVYSLAATNACGTTNATTNTVSVNQLPTTFTATVNPNPVCQGSSIVLTATSSGGTGVTYAWAGGTSIINNPTSISGTASITATALTDATAYTVTASAPGCATSKAFTNVLAVNKLPTTFTATVNPNPVCQGNSIALSATSTGGSGVTYAWTGGTSIINNPTAINGTASITATSLTDATAYTVTASAPGCATSTAITSVLAVNKLPTTFTATVNPNPVCQGNSVTLSATSTGGSGVTYAWTGGTSIINNPTAINGTASITATALSDATAYTVTASAAGCGATTASTLVLTVTATVPTGVTASALPNPICSGGTLNLNGTATGATSYSWAEPGGTPIASPTSLNTSVNGIVAANAGVYTLSATNVCGTATAQTSSVALAGSLPTGVTASASPNPICNGGTLALNGAATGAISYSWAGPGGASITSPATINATVNGVGAGNAGVYTLSATNACGTATAITNVVSVNQLPPAFTATVTPGTVCKGNSITLATNASGGTGVAYTWTGGTSVINNPTAINGTASITATALTDATAYTLTATAPGCGTSTAVTSVLTVNGLPTTFTASVNPNPVCQGNSIALSATSTGGSGVTYAWTGGTSVINNPTAINGTASITATALTDATAYTVTASAPGCATSTAITSVLAVNKLPTTFTATVNPNPVCQGSSVTLAATSTGGSGVTYAWTGGTSIINNPTAINGTASITATALTDATAYTVTASAPGCSTSTAVTGVLAVNKLPSTFTATVNPNPVCQGSSIALSATSTGGSGVTYAWTGGTSVINNPTAINGTASITATALTDATAYTVTASAPGCATSTAVTGVLAVNKQPTTFTATVNPNPVCQGSSVTLAATSAGGSGVTYAWTGGTSVINNPTAINGTASITATALTDATAYTVTASAPGCAATMAVTGVLTVNAMPIITATVNPNPVCQGNSITLSATSTGGGGVTYAWTGGTSVINNPTAINGTASITATALTDATAYTLTATAPGCAATTAVTSVLTVNKQPTTFTATVNPNPVCQGSSITLTATSVGGSGVSYAWTGGTSVINNPTAINGTASITATVLTDATAYTVTASAPGCATSTAVTGVLAVNKLPTTFTATVNPNPVCQGSSITLAATSAGGSGVTYAWTGGTSVINNPTAINGTASITATALTDATAYTVTASAPGCATSTAATGVLAVNKLPTTFTATVNPNPICQGGSITLSATATGGSGVTYAWTGGTSVIHNPTAINGTASITATALTDATAYTVTASAPGCATSTAVTSVLTVNASPTITASVNPNPVCQGSSIILSATSTGGGGVTYAWTGGTSVINNPTAINGTASITATALTDATAYTLTATAPGCTTSTAVTSVLAVNKLPTTFTATVNPNPVCQGNSVTLTATSTGGSGVTYAWTGGTSVINNPTAINGTASITATALTDATAYTVTASAPGCATSTAVTSVLVVNKLPTTFTATVNPNPVCQGNSITLSATSTGGAGVTYAWTGGTSTINNPTFINGAAGISSTALTDATAYTVTASAPGCATSTAVTGVLAVNKLPTTFTATVNPNPVCQGSSVTLAATSAGGSGVTYAWTGGTSVINNPTAINGTASITATALTDATAYTVTASAAGCVGNIPAVTGVLAINKLPTSLTATVNPNPVCQGSSITLAATSAGGNGVNYAWTGGTSVINNPTAINGTAGITATAPTDATAYTVTASAAGCAGNTRANTSALVVTPSVPTGVTASATPDPICTGGTLALNGSAVGAASYSWSGPGGTAIAAPTSAITSVNGVIAGNAGVYTLSATNVCGTATKTTSIVTINSAPTGVTASANSVLCVTGTLTLTGTASGATGYSWTGPGGTGITSSTSLNASVNGVVAGNAGVYTLAATNTCGTVTNTTPSVTVNATPKATPSNNSFICNGGTVTLSSSITGGTVVNYIWNGPDILTGAAASTATAAPTVVGANTYTLSVNDGTGNSGCSSQNTTIVTVNATPSASPTNTGYICDGGTVTIVANPANGASVFTWTGASILSGLGTATVTATPTVTGVYSLTVSDGSSHSGCSPSTQFTTLVSVNPMPSISSVFNTGYICNGGTVSLVAVPGTANATSFAWTGPNLLSTTGPDPMATPTVTSTYTVTVSDGSSQSGCSPATQYNTTVDVHITPSASPTSNSPICVGGTVSLVANETYNVIDYTWTGSNLSSSTIADPTATPTSSAVYTLVVSDGSGQSGCSPTTQYTTAVTVNGVPSVSVTNNGPVCADMLLTLTASSPANVTGYSWAGPVAITNSTLAIASVPNAQTNATGTYTVTVNNGIGSGCTASFTTQATVNALPTQYNVTGGGPYCADGLGVPVGLSGSDTGITYYLYNGSSPFGSLLGSGSPISYGDMTIAGTYSVLATNNITGCNNNMLDTAVVIVNPLPTQYAVLSSGTNYCYGHTGIDVSLGGSDLGIRYQLYIGSTPIGGSVNGNTDTISFGVQTIAGDYFAIATDTTTGCTNNMTGAAEIIIDSLPTVYNVSAGGAYCAGGAGIDITLSGSQTGVTYKLMNSTLGIVPMSGTGSLLNYGDQTDTGTYTIVATNNSTACASVMNGNPVIVMNALPAVDTVTGSGTYCQGTSGDSVDVNGSTVGINYRLYNGATLVDTLIGTGAAFSFGAQPAGVYTVTAFNATTGCTAGMYGVAAVTMNPAPSLYGITGIANYCANTAGVNIMLGGSNTGITYTLYNGATPDSAMAGTGATLNFGTYTAGDYSIVAFNNTTSCTSIMTGGGLVGINAIPVAYDVTGGGPYCAGSGGSLVGVGSSDAGVKYFLYDGSSLVDSMLSSITGTPVSFGQQSAAGTYTVNAMNESTGCANNMTDSVVVTVVTPVTPSLTVTTGMGDTVCLGNTITFTANAVNGGSTPIYQWYLNATLIADATSIYSHIPANGDVVKAVLISSAACASPDTVSASDTMTVETQATPSVSIAVNPGTLVCSGTAVTFTATSAYGGSLPMLNWSVNGVPSASGATYTYVPANGDNVSVELTSNFTCAIVDTAVANVMMSVGTPSIPVVEISANPGTSIATGQVDTLTAAVTNAGSSVSYQWVVNSTVIVGATNAVYASTFNNNDSVTCQVINYNGCNLEGFNSVKITVFPLDIKAVTFGSGDIRLIPNPNLGTFAIKGTLGTTADEEVTMEVTDILGQVIYKNKVMVHNGLINENVQLSSTLANGMYMMNLRSGTDSKVIHFVIEQ